VPAIRATSWRPIATGAIRRNRRVTWSDGTHA
jgi:hypothetical protein